MTEPRSIIAGAEADAPDVAAAAAAAAAAFTTYRQTTPEERAAFLEAVAEEIEADRDAIVAAAVAETNLPGRASRERWAAPPANCGCSPTSPGWATTSASGSTAPGPTAPRCHDPTSGSG